VSMRNEEDTHQMSRTSEHNMMKWLKSFYHKMIDSWKFIALKTLPYPSHRRRGSFLFALYFKSSGSKPGGKIHVYEHF